MMQNVGDAAINRIFQLGFRYHVLAFRENYAHFNFKIQIWISTSASDIVHYMNKL